MISTFKTIPIDIICIIYQFLEQIEFFRLAISSKELNIVIKNKKYSRLWNNLEVKLKHLSICDIDFQYYEFIKKLRIFNTSEYVFAKFINLQELNISNAAWYDYVLLDNIYSNKSIRKLNLQNNKSSSYVNWKCLGEIIKYNTNLIYINLIGSGFIIIKKNDLYPLQLNQSLLLYQYKESIHKSSNYCIPCKSVVYIEHLALIKALMYKYIDNTAKQIQEEINGRTITI